MAFWQFPDGLPMRGMSRLVANGLLAVAFAALVEISVLFASLPGAMTAIWLPAALTFTLAFRQRWDWLPGIFVGAFGLTVVGTLVRTPPLAPWAILVASVSFATLETCQPVLGWLLFTTFLKATPNQFSPLTFATRPAAIFQRVNTVAAFIGAAILAPLPLALVGAGVWVLTEQSAPADFLAVWLTWWLPAAMAHLIFTPMFLVSPPPASWRGIRRRWPEALLMAGIIFGLLYFAFVQAFPIHYMFLPVLIVMVFRWGLFPSSVGLAIVALVAILSSQNHQGYFATATPHETFIVLQSFLAVLSLTLLVLSAVITERQASQDVLLTTLDSLEQEVAERTRQLQNTEAMLTGFFASSPVGMGVLDQDLNVMRINPVLADMALDMGESVVEANPRSPYGADIDGLPSATSPDPTDLSAIITDYHQQVLSTQQPILNAEIVDDTSQSAWLASCFPIQDPGSDELQVGLVLLDIRDRKQLEWRLRHQAEVDSLTQLANRRGLERHGDVAWQQGLRIPAPLSLLLCDIDNFKAYNDHYGHIQGDDCLSQVARVIQRHVRRGQDLAFRYGGEEMGLLLPHTTAPEAQAIAIALQRDLAQTNLEHAASAIAPRITLSIGIATGLPHPDLSLNHLIDAADQALYQAKHNGKNCLVQHPGVHPLPS